MVPILIFIGREGGILEFFQRTSCLQISDLDLIMSSL